MKTCPASEVVFQRMNALGMQTIVAAPLRRNPVRKDSVLATYAEPVRDVLVALVPFVHKVMANENERI